MTVPARSRRSSGQPPPYARAGMNEALVPPVAPTRPHQWKRPTGVVEDPWAWLADRDDPATIAYLEAENAYSDQYFAEPARAALVESVFQEIKSRVQETDLSVPVLHGGWWYVTRTIEGRSYPVFCRSRDEAVPDTPDSVILDCNAEADGHDTSMSTTSNRRRITPCWHGRATSMAASATHCGSATSTPAATSTRSRHFVVGRASPGPPTATGCSMPGPTIRCGPTRSGATGSARRPPTTSSFTARTTNASSSRSRTHAAGAGSSIARGVQDERRVVRSRRRRSGGRRRASSAPEPPTSSTGSTTGATDSSSLTNLDAPDFRLMAATARRSGVAGPTSSPTRPAAG